MKLKEIENLENVQDFAGEKYFRTQNHDYGSILTLIDGKKSQIRHIKDIYDAELKSIPKRRLSLRNSVISNVFFYFVLVLLFFYVGSNGIPAFSIAALGFLIIAQVYMLFRIAKSVRLYAINVSTTMFTSFVSKNDLHTMNEEEEYCKSVLAKMNIYESDLAKFEKEIKENADVNVQAVMDCCNNINLDIPEFRYNAGKSVK